VVGVQNTSGIKQTKHGRREEDMFMKEIILPVRPAVRKMAIYMDILSFLGEFRLMTA
jgi:hypothetical protein